MPKRTDAFLNLHRREESCGQVHIQGQNVDYRLTRSARRSISLRIADHGLSVGAPFNASVEQVEAMLHQNGEWVLQKLALWQDQKRAAMLVEGSEISWLGEPCRLRRASGRRSRFHDGVLELYLADGQDFAEAFVRFCKSRARPLFLERLAYYAARLGVAMPPLMLSSARSRWGSCSAKGEIRLSWRLMHFPPALIDYVVAHELAHLEEMNHSSRFWAVVERLYPGWLAARNELRRLAATLPRLD
ncbi:MAG: M48 family metallopeptidase [Zoogloeaceae bacterium]|nr:M48 family metallopeptidase [Zoogloeaceae bacterium]